MSLSSVAYARFFTPQSISLLFCLNQVTKNQNQSLTNNQLVSFLIDKILKVTQSSSNAITNQIFCAQLLSVTDDSQFLQQYVENVQKVDSFNDFYRQVSAILKNLRALRSNKLQQGNLVDFLIRRMYIYFQKLDFKEIVSIYENFKDYKDNKIPQNRLKQHEFMITKSIEQVKFNLENYKTVNPQQILKIIQNLQQSDHTFKTSYLKGLLSAEQKIPIQSINSLHRYFDKSLGNLFQEKLDGPGTSNKINHCILSMAYSSLEMGQLDQSLHCISQGLRISQNNSDEQSINNCIIYLYKIAQQLGKYKEQILLAEHAITHSLNLTNLILMLYSCLSYSYFQKFYDCQQPSLMILKSRHISWTQALHFAKKKIYSSFENNCKNIYHYHRNLLIPTFICKLAILLHLPQLKKLLINPFYDRPELTQLQLYKEFKNQKQVTEILIRGSRYHKLGQKYLFNSALQQLQAYKRKAHQPIDIIKINAFKIKSKIQNGLLMEAYAQCQKALKFCRQNGFIKQQYLQQLNMMNKILIDSHLYYDALIKIDQTQKLSKKYSLDVQTARSEMLKSQVYICLGHINEALQILQKIEKSGKIFDSSSNDSSLMTDFYRIKTLINNRVLQQLNYRCNQNIILEFPQQCLTLQANKIQCLEKILALNIDQVNLSKINRCLCQIQEILKRNSILGIKQNRQKRTAETLIYVQKISRVYSEYKKPTSNDALLAKKVGIKIRFLYFR